jgi:tRNA-binding protein
MAFMANVSYDDFAKLDIRVAKIISTEPILGKTRIIKGIIDLGNEKRNVIIGGAQYYKPEDIIGKVVIVIANLEPKTMAGVESNAMLLAADVDDKPFWLTVNEDVPLGSPIKELKFNPQLIVDHQVFFF